MITGGLKHLAKVTKILKRSHDFSIAFTFFYLSTFVQAFNEQEIKLIQLFYSQAIHKKLMDNLILVTSICLNTFDSNKLPKIQSF